jgi:hypothetical protein
MSDYSLRDAAARLGTTTEAVRARLKRHSLEGYRDNRGRWRVRLPDDQTNDQLSTQPASGHTQSHVRMRERIAFLEGALAGLEARLADRDRELADAKTERDRWCAEAERLRQEVASEGTKRETERTEYVGLLRCGAAAANPSPERARSRFVQRFLSNLLSQKST